MSDTVFQLISYLGELLLLTLGTVMLCGLAVHLCAKLFARLIGSRSAKIFDLTAAIGTPVHELGHAVMCLLFGHKITRIKLWSPTASNGVYGFVEHSYNRKNPWAKLGNLFIGIGPIFSGLCVVILMLWLCFPTQWSNYLHTTRATLFGGAGVRELAACVVSLLASIPSAIAATPWRALLGLVIILPVSLHITLSWQDVKSSMSAMPMYLLMLTVFALITALLGAAANVTSALRLCNLHLLALFCVVIAFCAVWVLLALLYRLIRVIASWF